MTTGRPGRRMAAGSPTSSRDGNVEVYVMNADCSSQTRLTSDPAADFDPAWSPDASRIAFTSTRDGINQVYVMNADGSGQTNLTNSGVHDLQPAWSPTNQDRIREAGRQRLRRRRHERGRLYADEPDGRRRRRSLAGLVARRNQDRLHDHPRRERRDLRDECRRLGADESNEPFELDLEADWQTAASPTATATASGCGRQLRARREPGPGRPGR